MAWKILREDRMTACEVEEHEGGVTEEEASVRAGS